MLSTPDIIRQQFREALQAGTSPRIEDFLTHVDDTQQLDLFQECIRLELIFCRQQGTQYDFTSLHHRFPQFSDAVENIRQTYVDSANESAGSTVVSTVAFNRSDLPPNDGGLFDSDVLFPKAGRYLLQEKVGRGAFGEVWKAHDPDLDRIVAVKIPRRDRLITPQQMSSFQAEARCVAKLKIPGVVPIYDVGQEGSGHFIVSEFIDGETLADRLKRERISSRDAALLLTEVCDTLHRAHLKDLVHRDIKPNNILLDRDGRAFVADFGLAISEGDQLRESGAVLGTYAYMSPEQAGGHSNRVDARADIYSLGVILYQFLTNRLPFLGESPDEYRQQILHRDPRPPRTIDDTIPKDLERICLKCLSKSPADRYSTAKDLAADLRKWLGSSAVPQPALSAKQILTAAAAVTLAIGLAVGFQLWNGSARPPASPEPIVSAMPVDPQTVGQQPDADRTLNPLLSKQKDSALPQLEQAWQSQLGGLPREIIWPGYKSGGILGFRSDLQAYEVISEPVRLIQLGSLDGSSARLGITIEQPVWNGFIGIFLGYREVETDEGRVAQMQWISGGRGQSPDGSLIYRVSRSIVKIPTSLGIPVPVQELGHIDVAWPEDSEEVRLEIEIQEGRFVRGTWGRNSLPFHGEYHNARTTPADYLGAWGVLSHRSTSWFRHPSRQLFEGLTP